MKICCVVMMAFISLTVYSQNVTIPSDYEAKQNLRELGSKDGLGNVKTFDSRYEGVKGSPFIFEEWHSGEVFLSDKKRVFFNDMNYNSFQNEIVYLEVSSNRAMVINKYLVDFFCLYGEDTLTFVPLQLPGESDRIFAQVLYNRNSLVYKIHKKEFLNANYEGGYSAERRHDEFVDKYDLFFRKHGEDVLYKVKRSKKYMISAFGEDSREISKFINTNKLKFKDERDIVTLMEYYDGLK